MPEDVFDWLLNYAINKKKSTEYVLANMKPKNKQALINALDMWEVLINTLIDAKAETKPPINPGID